MPRKKMMGALDSCFGLVGPHQQSIPQLLSLASRVYKGQEERSTCGSELMRFVPTRLCQYRAKTRIQNTDIVDWAAAMKPASTHILPVHTRVTIYHVMPRDKRCGDLDTCFGLVGPHQQSIPQLLSLASRVYKGKEERSIYIYNTGNVVIS